MSRRRNLVFGWTLAVLAIGLFASLGMWQSRRAVEKQAMLDAADRVLLERSPMPLAAAADPARARDGRVGVRAYRIFVPEAGAPLLVDLGWLPLPGDRALPRVAQPAGKHELRGLLVPPPSTGIAVGPALSASGDGWLMTRVDMQAIAAETGMSVALAPRVLRLDPALPLGYARDLELLPNTLPPDKHRGYAVQWFALALAVLATALVLTFRK